jgi:hypothetical protein
MARQDYPKAMCDAECALLGCYSYISKVVFLAASLMSIKHSGGTSQCVELKLRWQFYVHASTCPEIYL